MRITARAVTGRQHRPGVTMHPMRHARLRLLFLGTVVLWSGLGRAQTAPATTPPSAATPPVPPAEPAPPPPPADAPTATPPPGQPPTLSPPPAPAPTSAPPLTLTPELAPAPPLELDRQTAQPRSERPVPFYRKDWFWGTVGLVVLTTAIIVVSTTTSGSSSPPTTTLGNMHAF
jgi:hypothetical protein